MKIYSKNNNNNKFVFLVLIFISTFNLNNQEDNYDTISVKYPSAYYLLNHKYVVIGENGIYFYNREFTFYSKTNFTDFSLTKWDHETVSITQFPEVDDGYIIIMVKNIFYIFDKEGTYLKHYYFTNISNVEHHCLMPYGKKNNILNYYIIYIESKRISIIQFKLNLMDYSNEIEHIFLIKEFDQYGNTLEIKENSIN